MADGGPFFRKVGGREGTGFRTALCYSADSLTCTSGFLEFLAPPSSLLRPPSSKLLISQIDSPIFPRICRCSHSHKCFLLLFSLTRQDLYETSKSIVDPSFTDLIVNVARRGSHQISIWGIEKNLDRIRLFSWIRSFADGEGSLWICRGHTVGNKYLGAT